MKGQLRIGSGSQTCEENSHAIGGGGSDDEQLVNYGEID